MSGVLEKKCMNCKHWRYEKGTQAGIDGWGKGGTGNPIWGYCFRFPPCADWKFPKVLGWQWCNCFEAITSAAEKSLPDGLPEKQRSSAIVSG